MASNRLTSASTLVPASLLAVALAATGALATEGHERHTSGASIARHIFEAADTDGDGALTPEEYADAGLAGFGVTFEDSDADSDGRLTAGEFMQLYLEHHPSDDGIDI